MKKNIIKVKKYQKPLICLMVMLLMVLSFIVGKITNANADDVSYDYSSSEIGYDSTNNNLNATNVKDAIDELYSKVGQCPNGYLCLTDSDSIVAANGGGTNTILQAYMYDENNETTFCVTGEEETCQKTICYLSKNKNACASGTIIDYKVNDTEMVRFHVLHDDGDVMTLQEQRSRSKGVEWYSESATALNGPDTILPQLESQTSGWVNVNDIEYNGDNTKFAGLESLSNVQNVIKNNDNYCSEYNLCVGNAYTYPTRIVKARIIMLQEAVNLGCTKEDSSCPKFMYNYLTSSKTYGGTQEDNTNGNWGYWTMNAAGSSTGAWRVYCRGFVGGNLANDSGNGARAVVVVNK